MKDIARKKRNKQSQIVTKQTDKALQEQDDVDELSVSLSTASISPAPSVAVFPLMGTPDVPPVGTAMTAPDGPANVFSLSRASGFSHADITRQYSNEEALFHCAHGMWGVYQLPKSMLQLPYVKNIKQADGIVKRYCLTSTQSKNVDVNTSPRATTTRAVTMAAEFARMTGNFGPENVR
jgi:hypothetical protein